MNWFTNLLRFVEQHLAHSTLVDAAEKDGLAALLPFAEKELTGLADRVAAIESHLGLDTPETVGDAVAGEPAASSSSTASSSSSSPTAGGDTPATPA